MSHTTSRRGGAAKFLALLASLTMILTGVAGVTFASAASATPPGADGEHKLTICHRTNSVTNPYVKITVDYASVDGDLRGVPDKGKGDHYSNVADHGGPAFTNPDDYQPPMNKKDWGDIIPPLEIDGKKIHDGRNWYAAYDASGRWATNMDPGPGQIIYNEDCNIPTPEYSATLQCKNGQAVLDVKLTGYVNKSTVSIATDGGDPTVEDFIGNWDTSKVLTPADETHSAVVKVNGETILDVTQETACADQPVINWDSTSTCLLDGTTEVVWTVSFTPTETGPSSIEISTDPELSPASATLTKDAPSANFTQTVASGTSLAEVEFTAEWTLGEEDFSSTLDASAEIEACSPPALLISGEGECVLADESWTITWTVTNDADADGEITASDNAAVPVGEKFTGSQTRTFTQSGITKTGDYGLTLTGTWTSGEDTFVGEPTSAEDVTISGTCETPVVPQCETNCGSTPENPTPPVVPEPQVEAAAAQPEAATAALPATVSAPAPKKVSVPAAATLPASVPAGEGSAPGLPMWALALIALGALGAAVAGKDLLGARK